ncbi:HAD-IIA family hydrolase [Ornithinimicrobium avium]|uniref:HAD-IIA family hydrolase n=1 Tax=Ornithinimicrobium avium TaxID=2283195 RepID=A0A345NJ52_9MICO|nr:HAD-IIA family hydrolase [Ornithinimicrobium avium]AXH95060.1 HAD-IIA family hydrolase [Ornithinimicrobium avium]
MRVRGILCDLDGVVYRGDRACPGAVEGLRDARDAGVRVLFMTNNASRPPQAVADQLTGLGLPTGADEVLNASQVAARVLRERRDRGELVLKEGAVVLGVGGEGVGAALADAGLRWAAPEQVREAGLAGDPMPVAAVVQGYGPLLDVSDLTEAVYAVRAGATWVATNDDATLPTERGLAIGNGSLVAAVANATGVLPEVVGKPHAPAYRIAVERLGLAPEDCLMLGDRLDTDIAGAARAGLRSALVLTGVSTRAEVEQAPGRLRPDHVAATIPELTHLWRD